MSQYDHSNNERIAANEADISNMKHWIEENSKDIKTLQRLVFVGVGITVTINTIVGFLVILHHS
jgi:hypothetical protein